MLRRIQNNIPFRNYLIMIFSAIIAAVALATGLTSLDSYTGIMVEKTKNYTLDISSQVKDGLDTALSDLDKRMNRVADSSFMQDVLIKKKTPLTQEEKTQYSDMLQSSFDTLAIESLYIKSIDFYLRDSGSSVLAGEIQESLQDPFDSAYYHKGLEHPTSLVWTGYSKATKSIDAVRLIHDPVTFAVKGMLVIRMDEQYLFNSYMDYKLMEISDMFIISEAGQILSSKNINNIGRYIHNDYIKHMTLEAGLLEGKDEFILYQGLAEEDWKVIAVVNRAMIFKDADTIRNRIILYLAVFILIGIFISILVSSRITGPIKGLVKVMKTVEKGDFEIQMDYPGSNEIAFLVKSFNSMVVKIKTLINNVYKESLLRKDMELKALQRQINPHFLFNTLEVIRWRARACKAYDVFDMIQSLSVLLEASMERDEQRMITVRKELVNIRHYIHLMQNKFGDRLSFEIDIDEEMMDYQMPKLVLQPFVENAIRHGVGKKEGPGTVAIKGYLARGEMYFEIRDDGNGMSAEQLSDLIRTVEDGEEGTAGESGGIALKNISKRIKLIYGEEYGFTLESTLFRGTSVIMHLPAINEKPGFQPQDSLQG